MKLKHPIQITQSKLNILISLKNKLLLYNNQMLYISDFFYEKKIEKLVKKHIFSKNEIIEVENIYLTDINVYGYSIESEYWGILPEPVIKGFINSNLFKLRDNFKTLIKTPLTKLGVKFTFDYEAIEN